MRLTVPADADENHRRSYPYKLKPLIAESRAAGAGFCVSFRPPPSLRLQNRLCEPPEQERRQDPKMPLDNGGGAW